MSKRLQVLLEEDEFAEVREAARREGVTVSTWVRNAIRDAGRQRPRKSAESKLRALEAAMRYEFPAPEIDQMLAEIERGYLGPPPE